MSYEGYEQCICEDGHYFCADVWGGEEKCHCGKKAVWYNSVDETNCDGYGFIDMEQFIETAAETKTCECCGHVRVVKEVTYRVPSKEETKKARMLRNTQGEYVPID